MLQKTCPSRKSYPVANAFEISDIQEDEIEAVLNERSEGNNVTFGWRPAEWSFRYAQSFPVEFLGAPPPWLTLDSHAGLL
jgi:hypothetical protein